MTNYINEDILYLLKKLQGKHPDDKDLQDFLRLTITPDHTEHDSVKTHYIRRVKVSTANLDETQSLIDLGITDPDTIHRRTGIPMEGLIAMGIKVPVHDYVLPVNYTSSTMPVNYVASKTSPVYASPQMPIVYRSSGFVTVKAISPEDALTMLEHNINALDITKILTHTVLVHDSSINATPRLEITGDPAIIQPLTKLAEKGVINDVIDSGLVSPLVKVNNKLTTAEADE